MSTFLNDLKDIGAVYMKSLCDGAIATVNAGIQGSAQVAFTAHCQESEMKKILAARKADPEWQKLVNLKEYAIYLEKSGKYIPRDEGVEKYIQRKMDEVSDALSKL